jgi:hypothetical protein
MEVVGRVGAVQVLQLVMPGEVVVALDELQLPGLERVARTIGAFAARVGLARSVVPVVIVPAWRCEARNSL